jgi:glyceraldehyde-3-phosphate dehydrogenase (NADP+)
VWKRRALLTAVSNGLAQSRESFASLIAREAGKPIVYARAEVDRAVVTFALAADECNRLGGDAMHLEAGAASEGTVGAWTRVAAGPVLAITPFNFPLNLVAHKLAPAFALGAPVILKPAPQTPLTALALARLVHASGAPAGLLSVVPTSNALAERMVRDVRPAVVSFTGSAAVGWKLKGIAGKKRVLLELGGNAAVMIEPDADVESVTTKLVPAAFGYAGQVCIKTQRVFAHTAVYDAVREALVRKTRALEVRDPMDASAVCSAMIDVRAAERVEQWMLDAGGMCLAGGAREGNRLVPAVVENAREGTQLVDEEVFGPVVTLHRYDAIDEAVDTLERGTYGLQAGLFTHDIRTVRRVFGALRVGALVVNDTTQFRVDAMPYGGVKDSGLGREGVRFALDEMSEKKLLVIRP